MPTHPKVKWVEAARAWALLEGEKTAVAVVGQFRVRGQDGFEHAHEVAFGFEVLLDLQACYGTELPDHERGLPDFGRGLSRPALVKA